MALIFDVRGDFNMLDPYRLFIDEDILDFNNIGEIINPYGTSNKLEDPKMIVSSAGAISDTMRQLIQDYEQYLNATKDNPLYVTADFSDDIVEKLCAVPNISFMITPDELKILIDKNAEDANNDTVYYME